jgi:hypothetical protein
MMLRVADALPHNPGAILARKGWVVIIEFGIGKLADTLVTLAKEKLQNVEAIVAFLKKAGYDQPRDDFGNLYTHALVICRGEGMPPPLLALF